MEIPKIILRKIHLAFFLVSVFCSFVCLLTKNVCSSGWKVIKMSAQLIHCIVLVKLIFHYSQLPYPYNKVNGVDKLEGPFHF